MTNLELLLIRREMGLTQREMAELLGINHVTISQMERSFRRITDQMAKSVLAQYTLWRIRNDKEHTDIRQLCHQP